MRLGFDLDEVIVDLSTNLCAHVENTYGIECTIENFSDYGFKNIPFSEHEDLNIRISKDLFHLVNDPNFQYKCKPINGAVDTLQKLKRNGHKLFFISSRPKPNQSKTFKWLRSYGIPFDILKVIGPDKCKGYYGMKLMLDMFVDDVENHLLSMWRFKKRWRKGLLLYTKPWNMGSFDNSKFSRVTDWKEILRHVGIQNRK